VLYSSAKDLCLAREAAMEKFRNTGKMAQLRYRSKELEKHP